MMIEEKIGRHELLNFAMLGIDSEIIRSAKKLDCDYESNADEAIFIVKLSEIRKEIGSEMKKINQASQG